jgi:hypothetical protein
LRPSGGKTIKRDASDASAVKSCSEQGVVDCDGLNDEPIGVERREQNANGVGDMSTGGTSADPKFIPFWKRKFRR